MDPFKLSEILTSKSLPVPGRSWLEIRTCAEEGGSLRDIARIVESDPVLTSKILCYANSAQYGTQSEPVTTAAKAVLRLGTQLVSSLALVSHMANRFNTGNTGTFDCREFWAHSLACGSALRTLVKSRRALLTPDDAFTIGVLSHMGWLCAAQTVPQAFTGERPVEQLMPIPMQHLSARYLEFIGIPADVYGHLLEPAPDSGRPPSSVGLLIHEAHRVASVLAPFSCEAAVDADVAPTAEAQEDWQHWKGLLAA